MDRKEYGGLWLFERPIKWKFSPRCGHGGKLKFPPTCCGGIGKWGCCRKLK
jgi:hypothetical protein